MDTPVLEWDGRHRGKGREGKGREGKERKGKERRYRPGKVRQKGSFSI